MLLWYKKVAAPINQTQRLIFVTAISIGILTVAVLVDKSTRLTRHARIIILTCGGLPVGLTALLFFSGPIFTITLCLSGFFAGVSFILQLSVGIRNFPYPYRCRSFGLFFALAGFLNTTTDLPELPFFRVPFPAGGCIMAMLVMALAMAVFAAGTKQGENATQDAPQKNRSYFTVAVMAKMLACATYVIFGLRDSVAYPNNVAASTTGFIRYIEVPLFLGIGYLCDKMGRHIILLASLCAALLGSAGILLRAQPGLSELTTLCAFASIIAISTSVCVILADLSHYSGYPTLLIGLGFAPIMMGQAFSLPVTVLSRSDEIALFMAAFVPGVLMVPFVMLLLGRIRTVYAVGILQENAGRGKENRPEPFGLSKRETQVFGLIKEQKTVTEMAQVLYLTESTVKQHIADILRKIGTRSSMELCELLFAGAGAPAGAPDALGLLPQERQVAVLLMEGCTRGEIARRLHVSAADVGAHMHSLRGKVARNPSDEALERAAAEYRLTKREAQVLRGIYEGKTNAKIAEENFISEETVKFHARNLMKKLPVAGRAELREWLSAGAESDHTNL